MKSGENCWTFLKRNEIGLEMEPLILPTDEERREIRI